MHSYVICPFIFMLFYLWSRNHKRANPNLLSWLQELSATLVLAFCFRGTPPIYPRRTRRERSVCVVSLSAPRSLVGSWTLHSLTSLVAHLRTTPAGTAGCEDSACAAAATEGGRRITKIAVFIGSSCRFFLGRDGDGVPGPGTPRSFPNCPGFGSAGGAFETLCEALDSPHPKREQETKVRCYAAESREGRRAKKAFVTQSIKKIFV